MASGAFQDSFKHRKYEMLRKANNVTGPEPRLMEILEWTSRAGCSLSGIQCSVSSVCLRTH